jgi:hypothetical protein
MRPTFNRVFGGTLAIFLGAMIINRYNTNSLRSSSLATKNKNEELRQQQLIAAEAEAASNSSARQRPVAAAEPERK